MVPLASKRVVIDMADWTQATSELRAVLWSRGWKGTGV